MKKPIYFLLPTVAVIMFFGFSIGVVQAGSCELPTFDIANFDSNRKHDTYSANITNSYFPLKPGTTFVYEPVPNDDIVVNTVEVTKKIKQFNIDGETIDCRQVHDFETVDGELSEDTLDWYAQDTDGNVWYCGEDTKAYLEDGSISTEGSWEAGVNGALPGYLMLANPRPGDCYQQESYEGEAEDKAKVLRLDAEVILESEYSDLEADSYDNCLVTKEWTDLEPGNVEHKYYASKIGVVLIQELKEKTVRVELVDMY